MTDSPTSQIIEARIGRYFRANKYFVPGDWSAGESIPGEFLRMVNGDVWFHPFDGKSPEKVSPDLMPH